MEITQSRLRQIVGEEIRKLHSNRRLTEVWGVMDQKTSGPWQDGYAEYSELTSEVVRTYKEGTPREFI